MLRVGELGKYVKGPIKAIKGGVFSVPNEPGIYALYKEDELIQIAPASDLKVVLQEIIMRGKGDSYLQQATHFCVEEVTIPNPPKDKLYLYARAKQVSERYQEDHYGEIPRCNEATPSSDIED